MSDEPPASAALRARWTLEPGLAFLNHGSFGACPRVVQDEQARLRAELERQPVRFLARELEPRLDAARAALAAFVGADPDDLAFVPNATSGFNTVLRALPLEPGDELLTTSHVYNAARTTMEFAAGRADARVVIAEVPFPIDGPERVLEAVLAHVGPRTRLAVLDHVTSPTGLVFPIEALVAALRERGVETLVDAAHGPGMVPLDLDRLGAAYTTGNCHKWLCAPKGAAFLHVRRDRQGELRPLAISHGANSPRQDRSRFRLEFDWTGTADPTPFLCVPTAIEALGALLPGGWDALRAHDRALALEARRLLCDALHVPPPAPESMIGALAAVPLPPARGADPAAAPPLGRDPLQAALLERHAIEVPVFAFPAAPARVLRISAQAYNERAEYERLAAALPALLAEGL